MEEVRVDKEEESQAQEDQSLPVFGIATEEETAQPPAADSLPSSLDSVQDTSDGRDHGAGTQEAETTQENRQEEQPNLPIPKQEPLSPALPDYIPAEVTLENLGFFTPSSKRIKHISIKEKILAEKTNPDGTKRTTRAKIIGNPNLGGLPITSDQDYFHAFEKLCYELADKDGRLPVPVPVPTKKLLRYAGKTVSKKELRE